MLTSVRVVVMSVMPVISIITTMNSCNNSGHSNGVTVMLFQMEYSGGLCSEDSVLVCQSKPGMAGEVSTSPAVCTYWPGCNVCVCVCVCVPLTS